MNLNELKYDCAMEQKKGLHFILTSIIIWSVIAVIHSTSLPIVTKNFYTFCSTSLLVPVAYLISKAIKVKFSNNENPMNKLGILLSMNQMLYLLIAMWVYSAVPDKMVMVMAMIFGAHLLPFAWLYDSSSYKVASIVISILALIIGIVYEPYILCIVMVIIEVIFSLFLTREVKMLEQNKK